VSNALTIFESLTDVEKNISGMRVHLQNLQVKFVY